MHSKLVRILALEFLCSLLLQKVAGNFWAPRRSFGQIIFEELHLSSASINEVFEEKLGKMLFLNLDFRNDDRNQ
jgi:hypothetical protein